LNLRTRSSRLAPNAAAGGARPGLRSRAIAGRATLPLLHKERRRATGRQTSDWRIFVPFAPAGSPPICPKNATDGVAGRRSGSGPRAYLSGNGRVPAAKSCRLAGAPLRVRPTEVLLHRYRPARCTTASRGRSASERNAVSRSDLGREAADFSKTGRAARRARKLLRCGHNGRQPTSACYSAGGMLPQADSLAVTCMLRGAGMAHPAISAGNAARSSSYLLASWRLRGGRTPAPPCPLPTPWEAPVGKARESGPPAANKEQVSAARTETRW
jgi:hypothetical protein